ncbi:MAG: hypothetical protein K5770_03875 [Lachnospiraceae bacterium]|nr:hypothetical protein [Lachnospiraceae bacterium]
MSREQSNQSLKELMSLKGFEVKEKHCGRFYFRMHMTQSMYDTNIEALELGVRAYNSLKRAGLNTIGELAETVSGGGDLKTIRNCGAKSVREIMEHLFLFQYNSMNAERRDAFLAETAELNMKRIAAGPAETV